MKNYVLTLILCVVSTSLFSQTADDYYKSGYSSFAEGDDEHAELLLRTAAEKGSEKAYGLLSFMYFNEALDHERDIYEAMSLANHVVKEREPFSSFVKGMVAIYQKDFRGAIGSLEYVLQYFNLSEAKMGLSICYYVLGEKEKAEEYALEVYNQYKDSEDEKNYSSEYFSCCALLSKITYDKDRKDVKALSYAGETRKSNCPLGQYMMGRCQKEFDIYPKIGDGRIEEAANYEYWKTSTKPNLYAHLEVFKNEIINYYTKKVKK